MVGRPLAVEAHENTQLKDYFLFGFFLCAKGKRKYCKKRYETQCLSLSEQLTVSGMDVVGLKPSRRHLLHFVDVTEARGLEGVLVFAMDDDELAFRWRLLWSADVN